MNQKLNWIISILLILIFKISAEVTIECGTVNDKSLTIKWNNNSPNSYYLGGCRFYTNSYEFQFNSTFWNYNTTNNSGKKEHTLLYANPTSPVKEIPALNGTYSSASNTDWTGTPLELPFNPSILLKTGSSGYIEQAKDEKAITLEQIDSLLNTPNFYNMDYRYVDTLGFLGGIYSGGIMDTWLGETQVIEHFSDSTWTLHVTEEASFDLSKTNGDPLYWMTVIMGQEYFQVDMQFMLSLAAKETGAGASNYNGANAEGAYGAWEIELGTGKSKESAYSFIFQNGTVNSFWNETYSNIDKATVINGYIYSIAAIRYFYDFLMYAEDACWKEILLNSKSSYFPLSILLGGYNMGLSSLQNILDEFWHINTYESYISEHNAHSTVESVLNKGYVPDIINGIENLSAGNKDAATDSSLPLIDMKISLNDLNRFFYGESGTASIQGSGGLLAHFNINRTTFNSTLEAAFDKLKGKAPSTQGEEAISLRYDFLTILRVVKDNFKFIWTRPSGPEEWNIAVSNYSKTDGCSGLANDKKYPYAEISIPQLSQDGLEYTIPFHTWDNKLLEKIEWTIDSEWIDWKTAEYLSNSDSVIDGQIKITKNYAENSGINTSIPIIVWIRTTDANYNSVIDTLSISFNPVSEKFKKLSKQNRQVLTINQNIVEIHSSVFKNCKSVNLSVYNLSGRNMYKRELEVNSRKLDLSEIGISQGIYFVRMDSNIETKIIKFRKF